MAQNPTDMTPREIDEKLAPLYHQVSVKLARVERNKAKIERIAKDEVRLASDQQLEILRDENEILRGEVEGLQAEADPFEQEYDHRGGWSRFYHVTNTNGHVHTSMHCSSCFPTTQYNWRVDLSGMSDEEVVEAMAYDACTVCLPIAPAEQKAARQARTDAERAERKAAKELKEAERLERKKERAAKLIAKYEKMVPARLRFNLKGTDAQVIYEMSGKLNLPAQVDNLLHDEHARANGRQTEGYLGYNPYELVDKSEFVGVVGETLKTRATVKRVDFYENDYDGVHQHIFTDEAGNELVWRATNGTKLEVGKTYELEAKVKDHKLHDRFGHQTHIFYTQAKAG